MKVIIADDEVYICSLIRHLVDWDALGLTLCGTFGNGDMVLEYLQDHEADILICDIEMPGMNGLELMEFLSKHHPGIRVVVISGYRNFEYALSALKYGAVNYLLKPLDTNALNDVLRSLVDQAQKEPVSERVLERASGRLQFLESLPRGQILGSLEEVNERYHFNFAAGLFGVLCINFPGTKGDEEALLAVYRMFEGILRPKLKEFCRDYEMFRVSPANMCVVLNYSSGNERDFMAIVDSILQSSIVEISCKTQLKAYIGVGSIGRSLSDLHRCFYQARAEMSRHLDTPDIRIFYADDQMDYSVDGKKLLTVTEKNNLLRIVEEIDPSRIREWVDGIYSSRESLLRERPWINLHCAVQAARHLALITEQMNLNDGMELEAFIDRIESCETTQELRQELSSAIEQVINKNLSSKLSNVAAYAQGAKQYIDKNYMNNVNLKTMAAEIGINPSYLSVLFKNEMQMNYSEYLLQVRMENAKKLLRQRSKNLSQIANAVGYDRVSYFSKLFVNYTGLKPAEYRRLHQNGLGDEE